MFDDLPFSDEEQLAEHLEAVHQRVKEGAPPEEDPAASVAGLFGLIERVRRASEDTARLQVHETTLPADGSPDPVERLEFTELIDGHRLGRFTIVRRLGEGGYGFVFLARDTELNRLVALKVPRPEAVLTTDMRARFLREAKAAALLSHPSIVPIFETGFVGPACFIVSQYIEGSTLADWLTDRSAPCPPLEAAQLVARLAEAVQHAHHKGVVHRDLKPANVLLETHASALPPAELHQAARITDFGLAKTDGDQAMLTGTGAIIGTPAYMAPEQASGRAAGPAVDLWALGAMLYELLTGAPPFAADSILETLKRVQETEPTRKALREAGVPRDLEAICLKCLEKSPDARYPDAAALEADLRRFVRGEPVSAAPATTTQRLGKWCRRNPQLAAALGALAILLPTALVVTSGLAWTSYRNFKTSERHREAAEQSAAQLERKAEETQFYLDKSREAIDRMLVDLGSSQLNAVPGFTDVRRQILEDALQLYRDLVESQSESTDLQLDVAGTHTRIGNILGMLGRREEAKQHFADSQRLFETHKDKIKTEGVAWARNDFEWGNLLSQEADYEQAGTYYQQAVDRLQEWQPELSQLESREIFVRSLLGIAGIASERSQFPLAFDALAKAEPVLHQALADGARKPLFQNLLGRLLLRRGQLHLKQLALEEAIQQLTAAQTQFRELTQAETVFPDFRQGLATASLLLGQALLQHQEPEQADVAFAAAVAEARQLMTDFPLGAYKTVMLHALNSQGHAYLIRGRYGDAVGVFAEAADLAESMRTRNPVPTALLKIGKAHLLLGYSQRLDGNLEDAESSLLTAHETIQAVVDNDPSIEVSQMEFAMVLFELAELRANQDRLAEAIEYSRQAVAHQERIAAENPAQATRLPSFTTQLEELEARQAGDDQDADTVASIPEDQ